MSILCGASAVLSSWGRCALFTENLLRAQSWACCRQPQGSCFSQPHLTFSFILAFCEPSKSHTINYFCSCFIFPRSFIYSFIQTCVVQFPICQVLRKQMCSDLWELLAWDGDGWEKNRTMMTVHSKFFHKKWVQGNEDTESGLSWNMSNKIIKGSLTGIGFTTGT